MIWSIFLAYLIKLLSYCSIMYMEPLFCSKKHWVPIIIVTFTKMKMSLKLLYCRELFYNLLQYMYSSIYYCTVCIVMYTSVLYTRAQTNNNCCSIHIKSTLKLYPSTTHILENFPHSQIRVRGWSQRIQKLAIILFFVNREQIGV